METRDILIKARALIEDPSRWTQGYVARTAKDSPCDSHSPYACKWCATGAIAKVRGGDFPFHVQDLLDSVAIASGVQESEDGDCAMAHFNDTRTHAEVLAAFDKAIAECA